MQERFADKYQRLIEGKPKPKKPVAVPFVKLPGFEAMVRGANEQKAAQPGILAILLFALLEMLGSVGEEIVFEAGQPAGSAV